MYNDTLDDLNNQARTKHGLFKSSPLRYLVAAMLAGAYVGVGSLVMYAVGEPLDQANSPMLDLITGLSFGVGLALVLIAGSELFTGNCLIFTTSALSKVTSWKDTFLVWGWSYIGNLLGAIVFSIFILFSGVFADAGANHFMMTLSEDKMTASVTELFFRAIIANWVVCLAIWTNLRVNNDAAKLFLIFILITVFIVSDMEHSVANMSLFGIALAHGGTETVTIGGFIYNMIPVTIGNIIGAGFFIASLYFYIGNKKKEEEADEEMEKSA
ncbi:nitrite transporter NirC [Geomicrobium halophilum]|uniref:Nitrite transporter NirC n=1 Tax=Geomicrobium halophilum TaxID=549000 RepID=A0A841PQP0_9BACL|nr:formate/nitrite transporter family protein [Geomicrobium halophilum]MBB6450134.1 nitrite transporter NirC [Geomicrobium halophilum]